jgi:hypothetical protein
LYVNPVIVAESTLIVHVALDTTSPGAAVASLGVVGDGDALPADNLPFADATADAAADVPGRLGRPTDGMGRAGVGRDGVGDGAGAPGEAVAGELGLGLGLGDVGKQKMIRMQVWLGAG